ncbi:MAG TPA: aromatic ring-hydroxylating dioxygenase subunit alpha [Stellaceae bacterium]|nr:aromatic ring-hydroxylating dioxygenase subunit alpha [Stellaceae bacterium]
MGPLLGDKPPSEERRHWPADRTSRVPFWIYSDPEIYRLEQERIFAGPSWSYVALEAEIPRAGDFKRSDIGDKPVIVVRDEAGGVNVVANRCAHRGVAFCQQAQGNVKEFLCPYHQWTYDLRGNLIGVPFRRGYRGQGGMPADFAVEANGLQKLRVARRHGAVFASFGEPEESLEDYLGPLMLGYFDRVFAGRELVPLGGMRQRIRSNWKLMAENIKDPYHASLLHVFLVTFGLFRLDQRSSVEMDETGRHAVLVSRKGEQAVNDATRQMRSFKPDFTLNDARLLDPVREFAGDATVVMQTLWPNLIIQQQSNTLAMRQLVTRGPSAFDLVWTFFGYADDTPEMRRRRLRQANLMGPSGYVSIDDSEVMMASQAGISPYPGAEGLFEMGGREARSEDHMVTEGAIRGFYRHYRRVMGI